MDKFENEIFYKIAKMKEEELRSINTEYKRRASHLADQLSQTIRNIRSLQDFMSIEQ